MPGSVDRLDESNEYFFGVPSLGMRMTVPPMLPMRRSRSPSPSWSTRHGTAASASYSGSFSVFHGFPPLTFFPSESLRMTPSANDPRASPRKK
jgi:hypothetical protein